MKVKEESEEAGLELNIKKMKIMTSGPITSNRWGESGIVTDFNFLGSKITVDSDSSDEIKRLAPWKETQNKPRWYIKKQRQYFANKGPFSQSYVFSSSPVWMCELDYKES